MSDRLAEIKETKYSGKVLLDVHWLIQEVERLRAEVRDRETRLERIYGVG